MSHKVIIGNVEQTDQNTPSSIHLTFNDQEYNIPYTQGFTILKAFIKADIKPPYLCGSGKCLSCVCKVIEGQVFLKENYKLTDEMIANDEFITCQAFPNSKVLKLEHEPAL